MTNIRGGTVSSTIKEQFLISEGEDNGPFSA